VKSKIIPIARWLSRRMLWMMGYDYDRVLEELYNLHDAYDSDSDDLSSYSETTENDMENNDFSDNECEEGMI